MKSPTTLRYNQTSASKFRTELNREVDDHLLRQPSGKNASPAMWFRVAAFLGAYWAVWSSLVFFEHSLLISTLLLASFVFLFKCIAYNVVHDGVHQSISGRASIDGAIYWVAMTMLGPSAYLWRKRHNVDHHHYVNVPGWDSQIEGAAFFRFSPHQTWKPYHRYQHVYASFIYMIMTLHWIFIRDFKDLFSSRPSPSRVLEMFVAKFLYTGLMIGVPALVLPYALVTVFLAFLLFHFTLSWMVTVTFAVSHINESLVFVMHDEAGEIDHSYFEHQLMTSMDYCPKIPAVNAVFGGMSAHVAHHLFPKISSSHLIEVTKIVETLAEKGGYVYHEDSLPKLVHSHFRMLRLMGRSAQSGQEKLLLPVRPEIRTVAGLDVRRRPSLASVSSDSRPA